MNRLPLYCVLAIALGLLTTHASAAVITVDTFSFDLDQFIGASVTTTSSDIFGSNFDNAIGADGFTLGELSGSASDRITLDGSPTPDTLTINYATGFTVGAGQNAFFVVYESNGDLTVDPEGQNFDISFNGGSFVDALNGTASVVAPGGSTSHNQIVFDLTDGNFNFSINDIITSVTIRNQTGGVGEFDPDFTFAAHAGTVVVPVPAAVWPGMAMLAGLGAIQYRRKRLAA